MKHFVSNMWLKLGGSALQNVSDITALISQVLPFDSSYYCLGLNPGKGTWKGYK